MLNKAIHAVVFLLLILLAGCQPPIQEKEDFYDSMLFHRVQMERVFPDSKTFPDCVPKMPIDEILKAYEKQKNQPGFDLEAFVLKHFEKPETPATGFRSDPDASMLEHIDTVWSILKRKGDNYEPRSSRIPLPEPYIVPGGRFSEIYYWDSYFTMLGLKQSGLDSMAMNMVENFAFLIDSLGFVPNGNRAYYMSRSQPPFFASMVELVSPRHSQDVLHAMAGRLEKEYNFWMDGAKGLTSGQAYKRVVKLNETTVLNRYWDENSEPRPEAYREDMLLFLTSDREGEELYRNIRAACESGWDFSSRWLEDHFNLATIHTTDILPVDLNCLLYNLELTISKAYKEVDPAKSEDYLQKAAKRKGAIQQYFWNEGTGFFQDYDFIKGMPTDILTLAGTFPLYFNLADSVQVEKIAVVLTDQFLQSGGFVTTLNQTGQQWDAPNGWAPLQWVTIQGLINYKQYGLAEEAAIRWFQLNKKVYETTGKMVEKYNVIDTSLAAGGGEYPLQDGFGWTNGVALALYQQITGQMFVPEAMEGE